MKTKILLCGFPHSGTTILRSIIGHIDDVEEIIEETQVINKNTNINKKYILCKWPFTHLKFFEHEEYMDYIKIFIIRNPLFIFSSLNERFNYQLKGHHNIENYKNTIRMFHNIKSNPYKNTYTIRYEDLFENNFQQLRIILDSIGFEYTDKIFNNTEYKNFSHKNAELLDYKPLTSQHIKYRNWQINQPFVLNNNVNKINVTEEQKEQILNDENILAIYPEIKSMV